MLTFISYGNYLLYKQLCIWSMLRNSEFGAYNNPRYETVFQGCSGIHETRVVPFGSGDCDYFTDYPVRGALRIVSFSYWRDWLVTLDEF